MRRSLPVRLLLIIALFAAALPAAAELTERPGAVGRIAVADRAAPAEPVPAWDPASPQRLVRIDGALYQQDGGFYYRADDRRISVRPLDTIAGWDELIRRLPDGFGLLDGLRPLRRNRLGIVDLAVPPGTDAAAWAELVFRTGLVRYAEVVTHGVYTVVPADPQFPSQWALRNTGQTGGTPGADVRAEEAWNLGSGAPSVVVAVLDSGTALDHEDLASNVWHNPGEIPANGVDDDGNGFTDDWEGWDFGNGNNDPRSGNFHGTHVTGIINAAADNGIGIAGLAGGIGGPGVRGMALAVGESGPLGSILDDAILYAADNGAQVITMSLSVAESSAINDALAYAYVTRDVFIDCAAGNSGSSVSYPARRPEVVAVASTDHNDAWSTFSNPGPEVEVSAPGSSILSTQLGNSYGTSSGTSFAAPHVAALAALVRSLDPGLPAADVRQLLIDTAEDVAASGFDNQTGFGRIDAFEALSRTATSDGTIRLDAELFSCSDELTVTVSDLDLAGTGTLAVTVDSDSEAAGETLILSATGEGSGVFRGVLQTSPAPPVPDGTLQTQDGDTLTARYVDADDGAGGSNVPKLALATTDCRAPQISDVAAGDVDAASARISWTTDEPAGAVVRYGVLVPPTSTVAGEEAVTEHSVQLDGLLPCTVYRFEVESSDVLGNVAVDDAAGAFFTFETFAVEPGGGAVPCHRGQVTLDRSSYGCGATVAIAVTDVDPGVDSGVAEAIEVLVTSTSEPDGLSVTLTEIALDSSRFEGSVELSLESLAADGRLGAAPGDLITATYHDADDGDGAPRTVAAIAVADCVAPRITGLRVTELTATRVAIEWETDEPADSRVEFGPTAELGAVVEDPELVTSHRVVLSGRVACERLHFVVSSRDAGGATAVADASGEPLQLNLRDIGGLIFHDDFETDLGWELDGEWDRATPQGLGSAAGDPSEAYSGTTVIGNDLTGAGVFAGDYEPLVKEAARSPEISTAGVSNPEVIFRRKLGVTSGDLAKVLVLVPGEFQVWSSSGAVGDADWIEQRIDLAAAADLPAVRIQFQVQSDTPGQSFGWNVDDLIVKDATQPDYPACGGCVGAPAFRGLSAVRDPDPCAPGGLELEWEAAPAWGSGGGGTYDVYRGTTAAFEPAPGNRVAAGLAGTSWIDDGVPADLPVWYVVRARNDEACSGGEGLDDGNLVRLQGLETTTRPLPQPFGDTLRVGTVGDAHVRLEWSAVAGAEAYVVRRSATPDFADAEEIGLVSGDTLFEDPGAVVDPAFAAYRVVPRNACGQEAP